MPVDSHAGWTKGANTRFTFPLLSPHLNTGEITMSTMVKVKRRHDACHKSTKQVGKKLGDGTRSR